MKGGMFRDLLLVLAPCAAIVAGLSSVDHHQRLVETGYRVARLGKERDALALEVEHRRVRVANLSSPARLLEVARERKIPVDYPIRWNVIEGDAEAARLLADRAAARAPKSARAPKKGAR
jgi:hypothetical protein